ncbi:MAG: dCTP deaminase, partial [Candidatus Korarchaeum sp.]
MLLPDRVIRSLIEEGRLSIDPLYEDSIRENGVDMRIGHEIAFPTVRGEVIDPTEDDPSLHFSVRK